jgi:rubrerythrin
MTIFRCGKCGHEKESRCKPKKCPACGAADSFEKKQE